MDRRERQARLARDLQALRELRQASAILDFSEHGAPPDRYCLTFHGRGLSRRSAPGIQLEVVESHRCELRLPYGYPDRAPDIRWMTPLFHPNVSFGGYLELEDLGLPWDEHVGLDVVCERLWDVARFAVLNLDRAANQTARSFFLEQTEYALPVDQRPLRGVIFPSRENLVRYRRRRPAGTSEARETGQRLAEGLREVDPGADVRDAKRRETDVLFIGEDTPVPDLGRLARGRQPGGPCDNGPDNHGPDDHGPDTMDGDVLYIGDD